MLIVNKILMNMTSMKIVHVRVCFLVEQIVLLFVSNNKMMETITFIC